MMQTRTVVFCCALLLAGLRMRAEEHRGVARFGGLALPGATVIAVQGDRKLATVTDADGVYVFRELAGGSWTVRVEMLCFESLERQITVTADAPPAEWDLTLLPVEKMQVVTPPAAAPPPATAQTAAANKPEPARVQRPKRGQPPPPPPANTASGFQRAALNQTVTPAAPAAGDAEPRQNPGEPEQTPSDGFLINGSVNNGAASPFGQSAAFGNNRRGLQSLYNGSLGFTLNHSALDARPYSLTGQDTQRPGYVNMTGVVSFGGPVQIPGLLSRRKAPNVSVNYQWTRNRSVITSTSRMPTPLERLGDFSQSSDAQGRPLLVLDPATGRPFPGNAVPRERFSPQAVELLRLFPAPNFEGAARYNYQIPLVSSSHQDSLQVRAGRAIGRRDRINGMLALQSIRGDSTNLFGFLNTNSSLGWNASVNWSHGFGPRAFLSAGFQFSRNRLEANPFFAERENISGNAGITGNNQEPLNWGPPALQFAGGIAGLSDIQSSLTRNQTGALNVSLFLIRGTHNFTLGGDFRRQQFNLLAQQDPRGAFTFTGAATGSDFAGFLLGRPDAASIAFGNADKYFRANNYDAYIADDWRLSPKLSANVGVRWDYLSPISEQYGRLVNLDVTPGFGGVTPVLGSDPQGSLTGRRYPESLMEPYRNAFQPRLALAWRPKLASSMVIRASYGVYYDTSVYFAIANRMAQQAPLSKSLAVQSTPANPLTLADGFRIPDGASPNTFAVDPDFRPGYAQNWQASLQRDLPRSLVLIVTYAGVKGTRAQQQFLPNTLPAGAVNPCPACPSGFVYLTSNGNSTRHAGSIQLRRRMRSGFTAQLEYTWAKAIDNAALGAQGQGAAVIAQDWLNLRGERGRSNFDQRHVLRASVQYTTGMGLGGGTLLSGWKGSMFKDWTFASQMTAGSGLPLTPIFLSPVRGTGITGSIRPDFTGQDLDAAPAGLFLNPAAVAAPAPGRWGNAGRNSINGPNQFSLAASLSRTFRMSDRVSADFRIDASNALNVVTYTALDVVANSGQFGLPLAGNPMRTVRSSLRVRF